MPVVRHHIRWARGDSWAHISNKKTPGGAQAWGPLGPPGTPGDPRGPQGTQGDPGDPRGNPWETQGNPGEHRGAHGKLRERPVPYLYPTLPLLYLRLMDQIEQHLRDFTRSRENPKTLIKIRNFTPLGISQHKPDAILQTKHTNFASRIRQNPL